MDPKKVSWAALAAVALLCESCSSTSSHSKRLLQTIADRSVSRSDMVAAIKQLGPPNEPSKFWADIANDTRYETQRRRIAVLQLFERHFQPGISLHQLGGLLGYPQWIKTNNVHTTQILTGSIPLEDKGKGPWDGTTPATLDIMPTSSSDVPPVVWMRIEGDIFPEEIYPCLTQPEGSSGKCDLRVTQVTVTEWINGEQILNGFGIRTDSTIFFRGGKIIKIRQD